jgi:hypothetical protein
LPELITGHGKPPEVIPFIGLGFIVPMSAPLPPLPEIIAGFFAGGRPGPIRIKAFESRMVLLEARDVQAVTVAAHEMAPVEIRAWDERITDHEGAASPGIVVIGSEGPPT